MSGPPGPLSFSRGMTVDVEALIRPVVEAEGLEFVDMTLGNESGRRILRVTIDKEGGVDLGTIATASERISRRLDLEGFDAGPRGFSLEVSSPGLERPLRKPEQFMKAVGSRVKIKTIDEVDGSRVHLGPLVSADETGAVVETEAGEHRIAYDAIASARTVFEWSDRR